MSESFRISKCIFRYEEAWTSMKGENQLGNALSSQVLKVLGSRRTVFTEERKCVFWLHICYYGSPWSRSGQAQQEPTEVEGTVDEEVVRERDEKRIQSGKQEVQNRQVQKTQKSHSMGKEPLDRTEKEGKCFSVVLEPKWGGYCLLAILTIFTKYSTILWWVKRCFSQCQSLLHSLHKNLWYRFISSSDSESIHLWFSAVSKYSLDFIFNIHISGRNEMNLPHY